MKEQCSGWKSRNLGSSLGVGEVDKIILKLLALTLIPVLPSGELLLPTNHGLTETLRSEESCIPFPAPQSFRTETVDLVRGSQSHQLSQKQHLSLTF